MSETPRPSPPPGRAGGAATLRDGLLWALPALAGTAALAVAGLAAPGAAVLGLLAAAPVVAVLAHLRRREVEGVAAWLEALPRARGEDGADEPDAKPGAPAGPLGARLARPAAALAEELGRLAREVAVRRRTLAAVVGDLPDPVLVVDRNLDVVRANAAARRTFGFGPGPGPVSGEAETLPLMRALRDPGVLAAVRGTLESAVPSAVVFSPTLERAKQFAARVEPLDLGDTGRGVLITVRERTEQVIIERMRSDFVANASHELRNPLASIQAAIETLRGPARDDREAREAFLDLMAGEAARMARLVDDLLSLSRLELAAGRPPTERCDVAAVVGRAVGRMEAVAARSRVRIEAALPAALPEILGDADQLHQLVANLLDNAIKYGGEGKAVRLEAAELDAAPAAAGPVAGRRCVRVAVADEGPGIAREHIPRLTERFYRIDTARSRRLEGTGLGLAIVKHILRRHQGQLVVESEPGRGSTFSVYLPVPTGAGGAAAPA